MVASSWRATSPWGRKPGMGSEEKGLELGEEEVEEKKRSGGGCLALLFSTAKYAICAIKSCDLNCDSGNKIYK